jgi:hypothetical protein
MEFALPSLTSASPVSEFSNGIVSTVSHFAAGLQRISARRAQNRAGTAKASIAMDFSAEAGRCESPIPNLSAGFGYAAWRG